MSLRSRQAVLLLAHGTPDSADQVPEYLRHVTGGRELTQDVIEEIQHHYALIGRSPLTGITMQQAQALQRALEMPAYVGMRNWHPFIADTVTTMIKAGFSDVVAICLAPQYSRTSVGLYKKAVLAAAAGRLVIDFVDSWHSHPTLISAFAERLRAARGAHQPVIFTAHSVPAPTVDPTLESADPYEQQARETARLVAGEIGLASSEWRFAFQSQGISGGPWVGPTVEDMIDALGKEGHKEVVIQPIGFVCDHVEVLYDIDIVFKTYARARGIALTRTESLNLSPKFVEALAELVHAHAAERSST